MGVFVTEGAFGEEGVCLLHFFEDGEVAVAEFAVLGVDFEACEEWDMVAEFAVVGDVVGDFDIVGYAEMEVVFAVAGAMWTKPVPASSVTKSAGRRGTWKSYPWPLRG